MSSRVSADLLIEVERLLSLPVAVRESEGIYPNDSQLKLLRKRIGAGRDSQLAGAEKLVADFSSSDSRLLQLVDALEDMDNG